MRITMMAYTVKVYFIPINNNKNVKSLFYQFMHTIIIY